MAEEINEIVIETYTKKIDNDARTSVGIEIEDDINYRISTDDYNITMVYDDVILGEYVDDDADEQGFKQSDGGLFIKDDSGENKTFYHVVRVLMIGRDVNQTKVGDLIVISKASGMQLIDFDGRETIMISERNVFMKVEPKQK